MPKIPKGFNARAKPYIKAFFVCCIEIKQIVGAVGILARSIAAKNSIS